MALRATSMRLEGAKELQDLLLRLPARVQKNAVNQAMRAGGAIVRDAAKADAPVGKRKGRKRFYVSRKTGKRVQANDYGALKKNIRVQKVRGTDGRYVVTDGSAFWGMFYEFGTKRQPPRPFLRPAFDRVREKALATVIRTIGPRIENEIRKLSKPPKRRARRS